MMLSLLGLVGLLPLFGGEDPVLGKPWHHEELTRAAAAKRSWSPAAAADLAFHTDYVDSYLYNPLWWVAGGLSRTKVALSTAPALAKVHFDDLGSVTHIRTMWRRYTSGAVAGLLFAAERGQVQMARNIVGVSLHPLQDFYSHTNWVDDPARRDKTWFDLNPAERHRLPLYGGGYEQPEAHGIKPHGTIVPECKALAEWVPDSVMKIVCHALSPFTSAPICEQWRDCEKGQGGSPRTVLGVPVPDGSVYVAPPGINLDSRWLARIGTQVRGLSVDPDELFDVAYGLALRTSEQWLAILDETMVKAGYGDFWNRVKSGSADAPKEDPFEKFNAFPYMFLTTGAYPPSAHEPQGDWYLRVRLRTDDDNGAGTDADIVAHVQGQRFLLDYMPRRVPGLAYDDFEAGDDQAYYLGPFPSLPDKIVLENQSADTVDVLRKLGSSFVSAVKSAASGVVDTLLSIIGGHADLVGSDERVFTPDDLAKVGSTPTRFTLLATRPDEGRYLVRCEIRRLSRFRKGVDLYSNYEIKLVELHCVEESAWDRFTTDDEPFVLAVLVNQAADDIQKLGTSPFANVDKGETRAINRTFTANGVPDPFGHLTLAIKVFESDEEGADRRKKLLDDFAKRMHLDTLNPRKTFLSQLGAAIAHDWKLRGIEVVGFQPGTTVTTTTLINRTVNQWIRGHQRAAFALQNSTPRRVRVPVDVVASGSERSPLEGLTKPLGGWWHPGREDHFLTGHHAWIAAPGDTKDGYQWRRLEGYLRPSAGSAAEFVPLYLWYHPGRRDNFISTNPYWAGKAGDKREGYDFLRLEGYVYRPDRPQPPGTVPLVSWWHAGRADNFTTTDPAWRGKVGDIRSGYRLFRVEGYVRPVPSS